MNPGQSRLRAACFVGIEPMEARLFFSAGLHHHPPRVSKPIVKPRHVITHHLVKPGPVVKHGVSNALTTAPGHAAPGEIAAGGPYASPAVNPAGGATGPFSPAQISRFYGINGISFGGVTGDGTGQTIAVIDANSDPAIVPSTDPSFNTSDLHFFDTTFGLPDPPSFSIIPEAGAFSLPTTYDPGWAGEIALDVEWAHALAPKANIVLVECESNAMADLINSGVQAAENAGASVISMSFTFPENGLDTSTDSTFQNGNSSSNVTYLAAAGDGGASSTGYPAFSPYVVGVGGTSITTADSQAHYGSEVVWNDASNGHGATGGSTSNYEPLPPYQSNIALLNGQGRGTPDVAFDADPYTGVYVRDTSQPGGGGWYRYGGTSLSSPAWAALVAIADQGRALTGQPALNGYNQTLPRLYTLPSTDFHDITSGNNDYGSAGNDAGVGYDLTTGLGTPVANTLVPDLAGVANITGRVFVDDNSNGVFDAGDTALAGQTVYLDLNNSGVQTSGDPTAITNASGGYLFTGQSAGGAVRLANPNLSGYVVTKGSGAVSYGSTDTINLTYFPVSIAGDANYTLQLDSSGTNTQITAGGTVIYSVASTLLSSLTISLTGSGDSLTVNATNGNPVPTGGLTLSGWVPGEALTIVGTPSGNDSFNISSPSLVFDGTTINYSNVGLVQLSLGAGTDALNVAWGSVRVLPRQTGHGILAQNFSGLSVMAGASAIFATAALHTDRTLVETSSLSVAGQLDLGGNDLIVHNGNLGTLTGLITNGFANGNWNGVGLSSSAARGDTTHLTALGIVANNTGSGTLYGGSGQALFDGQSPLLGDILIKYTYYGDANLDGQVNSADYARADFGYLTNQTGWSNGDFNYDGAVNGSDYTLLDNAFNTQGSTL
jgi:hypothetical protein